MQPRVLAVVPDRSSFQSIRAATGRQDYALVWRTSASQAYEELRREDFDAVVCDLDVADRAGLRFCDRVRTNFNSIPVIVLTAAPSLESALAAFRMGAMDYLRKPMLENELYDALRRAVRYRKLGQEVKRLRHLPAGPSRVRELVGHCDSITKLAEFISRTADMDTAVLITGETGTGKELVARALHGLSRRSRGPFVAINCAAMPETLLENELFGHGKGAYTDAKSMRRGLFLQANHGTLFLDEIGNLPLPLQPKLLRALQERRVRPVGGDIEEPFDARIITATNCELEQAVAQGSFRSDLFFRINVIHINLPPLRERGRDVLLLAQHFIRDYAVRMKRQVAGLSTSAAEKLVAYAWPGNIRELQNCMESAVAVTNYELISVEDLPERIQQCGQVAAPDDDGDGALVPMEEIERRHIQRVLSAVHGNKAQAARVLGMDRKTLYRKLQSATTPLNTSVKNYQSSVT